MGEVGRTKIKIQMSRESRRLANLAVLRSPLQMLISSSNVVQYMNVYEDLRLPCKFRSLLNTEFWHVKARLSTALHPFTITMNSHRCIKTVYMEDRLLKDLGHINLSLYPTL
jgi:hypothetical protein